MIAKRARGAPANSVMARMSSFSGEETYFGASNDRGLQLEIARDRAVTGLRSQNSVTFKVTVRLMVWFEVA